MLEHLTLIKILGGIVIDTILTKAEVITDSTLGTLTSMGDYRTFACWENPLSHGCGIIKISKDEYIVKATGEKRQFQHNELKSGDIKSLRRQSKELGKIILANITDSTAAYHLTLTYGEPQFDVRKLSDDFKNFITRLKKTLR